jgi:hypothetical protein
MATGWSFAALADNDDDVPNRAGKKPQRMASATPRFLPPSYGISPPSYGAPPSASFGIGQGQVFGARCEGGAAVQSRRVQDSAAEMRELFGHLSVEPRQQQKVGGNAAAGLSTPGVRPYSARLHVDGGNQISAATFLGGPVQPRLVAGQDHREMPTSPSLYGRIEHKPVISRTPSGSGSRDRPPSAPAPHSVDRGGYTAAKTDLTYSHREPRGHATWQTPAPPPHQSPPFFDPSSLKAGHGCGAVSGSRDRPSTLLPNSASVHERSSLVAQEPLRIINPIQSFFRDLHPPGKAMTLANSLRPVIEAIESGQITNLNLQDLRMAIDRCHRNGVDVKRFREGRIPSRLTVAKIASINLYTGEFGSPAFYSVLNTTLRDARREKCRPFVPYIWLLMHALRDCPKYEMRLVFRGVLGVNLSSQYPKGREVTWYQFSSCTCDLSVEQDPMFCGSSGVRTLFTIELTTGRARSIDQYSLEPTEAEVLLPPNSRFRVKGILNAGNGLTQIQLEELPCLEPILDFGSIPATVAAPVATHVPVLGGHAAVVLGAQTEDPEVMAFARSLKSLSVGTSEICLKFAKALGALGILSVDKLKTLSLKQAASYLKRVQMTDVQIATVMAVVGVHAQAVAAASRVLGKPDILEAAKLGNVALVKDHVTAEPACVNKRSGRCACLD